MVFMNTGSIIPNPIFSRISVDAAIECVNRKNDISSDAKKFIIWSLMCVPAWVPTVSGLKSILGWTHERWSLVRNELVKIEIVETNKMIFGDGSITYELIIRLDKLIIDDCLPIEPPPIQQIRNNPLALLSDEDFAAQKAKYAGYQIHDNMRGTKYLIRCDGHLTDLGCHRLVAFSVARQIWNSIDRGDALIYSPEQLLKVQ